MFDKMKLLVVDDMAVMRRIVSGLLCDIGFSKDNISMAVDGRDAIEKLSSQDFDFVVTDWNMPNVTGIDLLKHIRTTEKTKSVPVLMVTAEVKKEQIIEAAKAGVNDYIAKPFDKATLAKKVNKIFS